MLVNLLSTRSSVPVTFGQLALCVALFLGQVRLAVPANVFVRRPHGQPEAFHVMARLRVDVGHVAQEKILHDLAVLVLRVLLDGLSVSGEDGAGLEADGLGHLLAEEFAPVFGGRAGGVDAHHGRPLLPGRVQFPWDAVPQIEEFQVAVREGRHFARFGLSAQVDDLLGGQDDVVLDVTLKEDGDVGKVVVMFDDVVEEGVAFATDVLEGRVWERRSILRTAFGIDDAHVLEVIEP